MVQRTTPFRIPFPRRFLLRVHRDLFKIDRCVYGWSNDLAALTLFEKMVLVSEDRRFFRHNGVDIISVIRELLKAATFRKHGGASTIDMQFVRMATGYYERTLRRKSYEMLLAVLIQFRYSKIEILRSYLNRAFFGSHLNGAENASYFIFQKYSGMLAATEAAQLASMLVYPRPRIPNSGWQENIQRRSRFIETMLPRFEKRFEKLPGWETI